VILDRRDDTERLLDFAENVKEMVLKQMSSSIRMAIWNRARKEYTFTCKGSISLLKNVEEARQAAEMWGTSKST
jgi:hypothetical protein